MFKFFLIFLPLSVLAELPIELSSLSDEMNSKAFVGKCEPILKHRQQEILKYLETNPIRDIQTKSNLESSFSLRLKLHSFLPKFPVACKKMTQAVFSAIREYEDSLGAISFKQQKFTNLDYSKIVAPILDHKNHPPYNLNPKFGKFQFEDGDILITKGVSSISSTITSFTDYNSPFSHIAFVHINPKTNLPETIESYIGKGVNFFSMADAMKNENARILVLRAKDRTLASKSAKYMRDRVNGAFEKGSYIPYDYQLDFSDNTTLSCEEVAFDSFRTASGGSFEIPEAPSFIKYKNPELTRRIGMKTGFIMMPADMEIDSRFEIVLDWTDYKVVRDSWRMDILMKVVLDANESGLYSFPENYRTRLVPFIWGLRKNKYLWPMAAKISGIPVDFTPDVPAISIATIGSFKQVVKDHLPKLQAFDEEFFHKNAYWPPKKLLINKMNELNKTYHNR